MAAAIPNGQNDHHYPPIIGVEAQDPTAIMSPVLQDNRWIRYVDDNQADRLYAALRPIPNLAMSATSAQPQAYTLQNRDIRIVYSMTAPDGNQVPVTRCDRIYSEMDRNGDVQAYSDGRDEVVALNQSPETSPSNTSAWRVAQVYARFIIHNPITGEDSMEIRDVGTFDYSRYGFIRIGRLWINPDNQEHVRLAHKREANRLDKSSCVIL